MIMLALLTLVSGLGQAPTQAGLQIRVLAGEDAVNVIQQKTAVAPLIEVRDRNGVPVAGVAVTFSIQGANAAFPGAVSTLTAVTNAAGQATVAAVNPVAAGSFSIQVQAAFQGQTALATIAQSNVLTLAEAATGAASAGATTTAGAGGGGISGTTLGIVGAAVGGGALAATQLGGDAAPSPTSPAPPAPITRTLTGPIAGTITHNASGVAPNAFSCTVEHAINFDATMSLTITGTTATGTLRWNGTDAQVGWGGPAANCEVRTFSSSTFSGVGTISGTPSALTSSTTTTPTGNTTAGSVSTIRATYNFEGSFDGSVVTGLFTHEWTQSITGSVTQNISGRTVIPVTLR